jgi:cytochrome c oxidase subunit IV
MSVHVSPLRTYLGVFAALMVLTALTIFAAFQNFGPFNDLVAMGIAVLKATLVVLWFMHVIHQGRLIKLTVVSSVFWLILLFVFTLADYWTRGWLGVPGK